MNLKKLLAVVLTLCMLVAIVPIVAHADGDDDIECTGALVLRDSIDIKIYVNGVSDPSGYSVKYDDGETTTEKALSEGTQVADGKKIRIVVPEANEKENTPIETVELPF